MPFRQDRSPSNVPHALNEAYLNQGGLVMQASDFDDTNFGHRARGTMGPQANHATGFPLQINTYATASPADGPMNAMLRTVENSSGSSAGNKLGDGLLMSAGESYRFGVAMHGFTPGVGHLITVTGHIDANFAGASNQTAAGAACRAILAKETTPSTAVEVSGVNTSLAGFRSEDVWRRESNAFQLLPLQYNQANYIAVSGNPKFISAGFHLTLYVSGFQAEDQNLILAWETALVTPKVGFNTFETCVACGLSITRHAEPLPLYEPTR